MRPEGLGMPRDGNVCSGLSRAVASRSKTTAQRWQHALLYFQFLQPPPPTYALMSSYPTGGPGLYYGADPQQGVYHDPPQFDPYNTRLAHDAYEHGEGEYREPYKDEPIASYSLPQGQSMEPLEPTTKEEISYYAEETNATPRKPRYV